MLTNPPTDYPIEPARPATELPPPVVPPPVPPAPLRPAGIGDILVLLFGMLLALGGVGIGLLGLLASFEGLLPTRQQGGTEFAPTLFVAAELALVLGLPLCVAGLAPLLGRAPGRFGLGRWWAWLLAWFGVMAAGQFVMLQAEPPVLIGATLHLAGMLLPVLALVAWIAPPLAAHGITWRGAWLHLVSGASLSVVLAIALEIAGVLILAVVVYAAALVLTPDAPARLQELINAADSGRLWWDSGFVARLLSWTPLVVFAILVFSVLVPLVEEFAKAISVLGRLVMRRGELDPGAAFMLGALCGAGFALFEGPLNTVAALGDGLWLLTVVLRAGAMLLHAFNTALTAWGWAELLERRRWRRWLLGVGGALLLHGLWNGITLIIARAGYLYEGSDAANAVNAVFTLFLVGMSLLSFAGLVFGARRAQPPAPAAAGEPDPATAIELLPPAT